MTPSLTVRELWQLGGKGFGGEEVGKMGCIAAAAANFFLYLLYICCIFVSYICIFVWFGSTVSKRLR